MRLLDNCSLDPESVRDIQDDINYYLDCNQVSVRLVLVTCQLCQISVEWCQLSLYPGA